MSVARNGIRSRNAGVARPEPAPENRSVSTEEAADLVELLAAVAGYRAAVIECTRAVRELLAAGDLRDAAADARDEEAVEREQDRDLAALLDVDAEYGVDWPERRAAALDRERAKQDRVAARLDRWALADHVRRLVRAGENGFRQDVIPSLSQAPDGPLRSWPPVDRVRGRVPTQASAQRGSLPLSAMAPAPQLRFTGTVWVDGAHDPISSTAASWEEAVVRLNLDYGADRPFVLRIDGATPA